MTALDWLYVAGVWAVTLGGLWLVLRPERGGDTLDPKKELERLREQARKYADERGDR